MKLHLVSLTASPAARSAPLSFKGGLVLALALLAGCASPGASQPAKPSAARSKAMNLAPGDAVSAAYKRLRKGLTAAEVKQLLGAPAEVKPITAAGVVGEVWVYTRTFMGEARQVAAEMVEVPFTDPISGESHPIKEPLYKTEITNIEERTELLLLKGQLIEWKQTRVSDRQYH